MSKRLRTSNEARSTGARLSDPVDPASETPAETSGPVVAPHDHSDLTQNARRRAVETVEEAHAVAAQAAHQLRRSRRNRAAARLEVRARVLVVDDSKAFLRAASSLVSAVFGLRLVGVAESGEEAIARLPELKPDLVLLDVHLPGLGGLETARAIRRARPETVVVLVSADPASLAGDADSVGAAAFVPKAELCRSTLEELWLAHMPRA